MITMETVAKMAGFKTIKDLGWLNGYNNGLPKEYEKCVSQEYEVFGRKIGNCAYEYTCDICNICYSIDSSG